MDFTIRDMTRSDYPEIVEIYFQGIQTDMATFEFNCPSFEEWDKEHLPFSRHVAEKDSEVIGWAAIARYSPRDCYSGVAELSIYVDNNYKHQGVGTALIEAIKASSVKLGVWAIEAPVFEENMDAIALLQKCGFRKVGTMERLGKDRFGAWRSIVLMEYRIQTDKAGGCDCAYIKKAQAE